MMKKMLCHLNQNKFPHVQCSITANDNNNKHSTYNSHRDNNTKILLFLLHRYKRPPLGEGTRRNHSLSHTHSFQ